MSEENKQNTNDIFKQKFEDFNIEPSPQLWTNIENSLIHRKRNKLIIISTISVAASLLILLIPNWFSTTTNYSKEIISSLPEKESNIYNNTKTSNYKPNDINNSIKPIARNIVTHTKIAKNISLKKTSKNKITRTIIVPPDTPSSRYLLALNNHILLPTIINRNDDLEKIRNNIDIMKRSEKQAKEQPKIQLNFGHSRSGSNSNNVYSYLRSKFSSAEFSSLENELGSERKADVKINADFGLIFEKALNNKVSIISGVRYLSFTDDKETIDAPIATLGKIKEMNEIINNIEDNTINKINQKLSYLEIPIHLKYYIIKKNFSLYLKGGVGLNFLIKNNADIFLSNGETHKSKTSEISKLSFAGNVGIGISYNINKSIYFTIEPHFRHYFNSLSTNKDIKLKPDLTNISFGLGIIL